MITNKHMIVGSRPYGKAKIFQYLGPLLANQNSIHEEIKYTVKVGNNFFFQYKHFVFSTYLKQFEKFV